MKMFLSVLTLLMAGFAFGGSTYTPEVTISLQADGSGYAHGSMRGARESSDHYQMIGCELLGGDLAGVYCQARDENNQMVSCSSGKPGIVEAAQGITSFSIIRFQFGAPVNANQRDCSELRVRNNSGAIPSFKVVLPVPVPVPVPNPPVPTPIP